MNGAKREPPKNNYITIGGKVLGPTKLYVTLEQCWPKTTVLRSALQYIMTHILHTIPLYNLSLSADIFFSDIAFIVRFPDDRISLLGRQSSLEQLNEIGPRCKIDFLSYVRWACWRVKVDVCSMPDMLKMAFINFPHQLSLCDRLRTAGSILQWLVAILHLAHTLPMFHVGSPCSWNVLCTQSVLFHKLQRWINFPADAPFLFPFYAVTIASIRKKLLPLEAVELHLRLRMFRPCLAILPSAAGTRLTFWTPL